MNRSYDPLFKFFADLRLKEPKQAESIDDIIPPEPEEMDEDERSVRKQIVSSDKNTSKRSSIYCAMP